MNADGLADEIWVVTEGAAGMENQCLGLAERLSMPIRSLRIALRPPTPAPPAVAIARTLFAGVRDRPCRGGER